MNYSKKTKAELIRIIEQHAQQASLSQQLEAVKRERDVYKTRLKLSLENSAAKERQVRNAITERNTLLAALVRAQQHIDRFVQQIEDERIPKSAEAKIEMFSCSVHSGKPSNWSNDS